MKTAQHVFQTVASALLPLLLAETINATHKRDAIPARQTAARARTAALVHLLLNATAITAWEEHAW